MSKLCKRILLILAVFSSFLTLFACSAIQIDTYHVELPQDKYQLRVGQEIEALPIVSKNGQECDLEVSYHSYDASIATYVDGKIVALKSGEVRIKVTLKNNSKVYATALVTVVNDDSLIVDFNYEKTMIKGTTQLLTYELLVEKNRKLTFTSSNENVATIDELGNIKAITVGTTTIETVVSSLYDEGVSKTYKLVIEVKDLTFAINYVLDGGTNSENNPNEYVPEKLPLLLENPTKSGYKFVGWYDNENFTGEAITEISAGTMGDVTLYAKWNALDYRISYELNGGTNAENPDGYDVSDLPVSLHAPSRTGYIFKGWYMGENRVLAIPVGTTGNVVVSAKWEPITYTIDFNTNGGLPTLSSIDYTIESDSFTLQEITKVGYTFDGWYNGETKVTEITTGSYGNVTLVAKWTADLYTISYDLADGVNNPENPTSYTIESGLITLKDPTKEGYTFAGWFNGEQLITTIDSNTLENISLTAKWTVNSYKLTFDVDGNLTEKTFKYGESVRAIENPTKVGHTFAGWSKELPVKMPANDLYVSATWTVNSYKLTFDVDGNLTEKTFKYGESVRAIENPTKVGHTFAGWSKELPVKMPANDLYVSATWTVNSYKITFDVDGNLTEKTFKYGETVVAIENPTKVGHTFAGWSEELPKTMPANDITVEAIWTVNSYKLTLDVDGNLTEKTFKYGETVVAIENPTKVGYTFAGWSEELPVKMPANDITVEATWTVNSYKLTFDVDGNLTEKTFKYGESVTAIENPTKEGHTFAGWSKEIPATMPAEDLTVKATWTVNSYDITYDFAGGEFKNVDYLNTPLHKFAITDYLTYQAGTGAEIALMKTTPGIYWVYILLKNTNNDGLYEIVQIANGNANVTAEYDYVIAWHDGLTDTSAKSILQKMLASSSSYIGGYVKLSNVPSNKTADCNITAEVYKASDIVINDPLKTSYTIEDSVELPTPSKTGYVFDGWYVNGTKLENIALGSTGNLVLKAQWKVMVYNISLNPDGGKAKYATWDEFVADFLKDFCTYVWNNPTRITSAADFWGSSYSPDTTVQAKIISFFTDNAEKWGFLSDELDAGVKKANWTKYDKTHYYYYRCNLTEYLTKTKRTEWPESCGAFDGMSDPAWVGYYELNYTVDDNIMLPQLYKEGYTFLGWFNGDTKVDMIKAGTTGNLNLVAKWKITTDHEGTEDDPYSVDDALKIAGTLSSGEYTELVYITGVVTDAGTFDTYYKNVYICDKNSKETILVYNCNISEIVDVIYVNDTVVIKGYITNYKGNTLEIASKGNSYATFISKEAGLSTITVSETSSEFAIVNELSTVEGLNGSSFTFKVSVTEGYEIVCVKVNGVEITPNNDVYTATISGNTVISVETKVKGAKDPETIVSLTFPDDNSSNNGIGSYTDEWTAKIGTYEWTIANFNNNSWKNNWTFIKAGRKKYASIAMISSKFTEIITSITITVDSITTDYVNSFKLVVSKNADGSDVLEEISLDLKKGSNEIKISKATSGCYYIFTFDFKSAKSNGVLSLSKLEYIGYKADSSDPSKTHNISYVNLPEGATNSNPTSYTEGETITLVDPVLPGYTFEGWYDNAECTGTKITEISGYTTDITLCAKFAKILTHSISYKYNVDSTDITNDNPTEYAEGDSTVLKDAKLTNYAFSGWYLDSEYTNKITAIDHSWTTDIVIFGKFETSTEKIIVSTFKDINLSTNETIDLTWKLSVDANSFETASLARGVQIGAAKGTVQLSAANSTYKVKKIVMTVSTNSKSDNQNSIALTVGEQSASTISLKRANNYEIEFVLETATLGDILFTINDANKSVYIKSITIYYM